MFIVQIIGGKMDAHYHFGSPYICAIYHGLIMSIMQIAAWNSFVNKSVYAIVGTVIGSVLGAFMATRIFRKAKDEST